MLQLLKSLISPPNCVYSIILFIKISMTDSRRIIKSFATILRNNPIAEEQSKKFIVGEVAATTRIKPPDNFDGRVVWGKYLSKIKNQGECGICYSCSTVGSLADRFNILSLGAVHLNLSAADLVMCLTNDQLTLVEVGESDDLALLDKFHKDEVKMRDTNGCKGNTLYEACKYLYMQGVPTEECIPDSLVTEIGSNAELPFCEDIEGRMLDHCLDSKYAQASFRASVAYQLKYNSDNMDDTERVIKTEIYKWGPISGGFLMYDDFLNDYDGKTIYTTSHDVADNTLGGHAIRIVGWGEGVQEDRIVKYWICANSWSEEWGDGGYFKIEMFLPGSDLEKNIVALLPELPGLIMPVVYTNDTMITIADRQGRKKLGINIFNGYTSDVIDRIKNGELIDGGKPIPLDPRYMPAKFNAFIAGNINKYNLDSIRKYPLNKFNYFVFAVIIFLLLCALLYGVKRQYISKRSSYAAIAGFVMGMIVILIA